ncbi:MAG: 16S rRNA (adenine(1518)-N(6)/adenine(1519)-N(6))-dimethyltransferase RsmA [Desulfurococcus sp.]|nr:16S rRNA (adenine(1518)-N(6)/adenine(1519)-N(6))-dimethyltransferase RsmA [Desulfurococcus sp.]
MGSHFKPEDMSRQALLSWTLRTLRSHGLKPRRKLSQNFTVNPYLLKTIKKLVEYADTLEIGCGIGTLTLVLSRVVPRLVSIEIDERLLEAARENVDAANTILVKADATRYSGYPEQVVGNIPYHITSEILVLIARSNSVRRAVLTVQKDVAERLTANPGSDNYGRITVLVKALFKVEVAGVYGRASFYPKPEVEHAVLVLTRIKQFDTDIEALEELTRVMFTQRRRIALKVLAERVGLKGDELYPRIQRLLAGKRVYEVEVGEFLELARIVGEAGLISRD